MRILSNAKPGRDRGFTQVSVRRHLPSPRARLPGLHSALRQNDGRFAIWIVDLHVDERDHGNEMQLKLDLVAIHEGHPGQSHDSKERERGRGADGQALPAPARSRSFFRLSWLFARQTLLATSEIQAAVMQASLFGQASMVFLGNSVFAIGKSGRLQEALAEAGVVYVVGVDNRGARVL